MVASRLLTLPSTAPQTKPVDSILDTIGATPLVALHRLGGRADVDAWAKLESFNPSGSAKDRPALEMLRDALRRGVIGPGSTIIESSSGNLGTALARCCRVLDMHFICVADDRATTANIATMRAFGATVHVVSEPDPETGDLLVARLARVQQLLADIPGAFWPNQYASDANTEAHARGTIREIDEALDGDVDLVLVATSTTGTLSGCARYLREHGSRARLVAVDAVGSVLFGGARARRVLPGFGAGTPTELSRTVQFDDVLRIDTLECVVGCRRLLAREAIFAGASGGAVASAFEQLAPSLDPGSRCALILHDGGAGYLDTVYDDGWVQRELGCDPARLASLIAPAAQA